ncbi:MAG: hypothetical protein WCA18_00600, partial [Candidatus Nanoarchaeia archaeon]
MKRGAIFLIGLFLAINLIFFVSAESASSVLDNMLSQGGVSIVYGDNAAQQDNFATSLVSNSISPSGTIYKASQIGDYNNKNLILVGGPCANQISAQITANMPGYGCSDWKFNVGEALIKVFNNGNGKIILVSGTTWQDTLKLVGVFQNYASSSVLASSDEIVLPTLINDYTCGNGICEAGESSSTCPADCIDKSSQLTTSGVLTSSIISM